MSLRLPRREFWLLLLFAAPLFVALEEPSLRDANEAYYTQTPREMLERGDWLVPYFNGEPRLNKPPLSYWLVAAFYKMFSVSVLWERLPMALLAFSCVAAVFVIGKSLWLDQRAALLAAGILATTFRFLILARRLLIDVLLLSCILWGTACFLIWLRTGKKRHFLLSCAFFGLAFLAKGPVGLLPIFVLLLFVLLSGRRESLHRAPWVTGGLLLFALCASWYAGLGLRMGWDPVANFFLHENAARFLSTDFGPLRGPFFYVGVFLADFFPWSLLFPAAVFWSLAGWKSREQARWTETVLLPALWCGFFFLLFSVAHNKIDYYLLPVYPFAALWTGAYLNRARPPGVLVGVVGALMLVFAIVVAAAAWVLVGGNWWWIPLLALPILWLGLRGSGFVYFAAGLAIFYFASFALYLGPLEAYQPVRPFARTIQNLPAWAEPQRTIRGARAGYYKIAAPSLAFYLNTPILELADAATAARHLASSSPIYLIVHSRDFPELERAAGPLQILEIRPMLQLRTESLVRALRGRSLESLTESWTVPVYLVTNDGGT
jgi:hypothetical protein